MKRILMLAMAALGLTFGAKAECPDGYTDVGGGNYSFKVDDKRATSGKWYTSHEFQPVNGSTLDGAEWYVDNLIAFQDDGKVLNLVSGKLTWTSDHDGWGGGVYPGNTEKYLNFKPGSTLVCINTKLTRDNVFEACFASDKSNFRYNDDRITKEDEFKSLFTVKDGPNGGVLFFLTPTGNGPAIVETSSVSPAADGKIQVSTTFLHPGSPVATVYAAWATEDLGADMSDWSTLTQIGTAKADSPTVGFLTDVPDRTYVTVRVFVVSGEDGSQKIYTDVMRLYSHYYGVSDLVNEFLGTAGTSLDTPENWLLGHVPTTSEIRWFDKGTVEIAGNFAPRATDEFRGGVFIISGELQPVDGTVFAGTAFTAARIAPQKSPGAFTAKAGSFVITSGTNSFWNDGRSDRYCDIPEDSTATFTFPMSKSNFVNNWLSKFRYKGAAIVTDDFNDPTIWTVSETKIDSATSVTFYLTPSSEGAPEVGAVTATVDPVSVTTVTVDTTLVKIGSSQPTSFVVMYGFTAGALTQSVAFEHDGDYVDGTEVSVQLPNLIAKKKYYFRVEVINATGRTLSDIGSFITHNLTEADCAWTGETSSKASVAANWSNGMVPSAATDVLIYDVYAQNKTIEWDIPAVKSWTQESFAGGSVEVVFESTKEAPVVISGDATILGGSWTHKGPAADPVNCLNVHVAGNLTIATDSKIETKRTGYHQAGPGKAFKFGELEDDANDRQLWTGGAYAGDSGHATYTDELVSYGSILNPRDWGSAGHGDGDQKGYAGAGLIILVVDGALTVNGNIEANGFGWNLDNNAGSSAGTVNVTAGSIAGSGKITANGGSSNGAPGGGGRIRVALTGESATFTAFDPQTHIVANSGTLEPTAGMTTKRDTVIGAAGTITLVEGGVAKVVVADTLSTDQHRTPTTETLVSATHLPARQNPTEDLKASQWELQGYGKLRLTADAKIAALAVTDTDKQKVFLDGYTLTVTALTVGGKTLKGTYTAAQLNTACGAEVFAGEGTVRAGKFGFAVVVR